MIMYRNSKKKLDRQDYVKGIEGFINFTLFNLKNISGEEIICLHMKSENKFFYHIVIVTVHLLQK